MFQDLSRCLIETGFLADLRRGSNSLNSDTVNTFLWLSSIYVIFMFIWYFWESNKRQVKEKMSTLINPRN